MPPRRALALPLLCALLGGCATTPPLFGPTSYEQTAFHYRIRYDDPRTKQLLGPDWRLDNLIWNKALNRWVPKDGPGYRWTREQDINGDGTIGMGEVQNEPVHDLQFLNGRDRGVIWTKAHPLLFREASQDLDVILDGYAEQLSGEGLYAAGTVFSAETVKARRYVSFIVERTPIQLGPNLGVSAVIELAEAERLRLDPRHRSARLKVVFSKMAFQNPTFSHRVRGVQNETVRCGKASCERGVALLVVGYYNAASHFAEHVREFDDFVQRLSVPPESVLPVQWRSRPVKTALAAPPPPPPASP